MTKGKFAEKKKFYGYNRPQASSRKKFTPDYNPLTCARPILDGGVLPKAAAGEDDTRKHHQIKGRQTRGYTVILKQ